MPWFFQFETFGNGFKECMVVVVVVVVVVVETRNNQTLGNFKFCDGCLIA